MKQMFGFSISRYQYRIRDFKFESPQHHNCVCVRNASLIVYTIIYTIKKKYQLSQFPHLN